MSISDGDALRQAILDQPDDDTLRLVYADWLEENGQSDRGAFVRAQVWQAQAEPYSPDFRKHAATAGRLLDAHKEWNQTVRRWVIGGRFVRGFVEHAQVNVASFPRDAADLFAAEPIRSLHLTRYVPVAGPSVSLLPFFDTPQLERVTRLDLKGLRLSPVELDPVVESPHLRNLTDLGLSGTPVMPDWLAGLLTGPALPALTGLDLTNLSHLGPRLADSLPFASERQFLRLNVTHVAFNSGDIQRVLGSRCMREVEELRLGWMIGTDREGALTHLDLGWVIPWNRLRLLDLDSQGIGDDGVVEIVKEIGRRKEPLPLRWLGLAHNRIGADGARALVRSDPAKLNLYYLDLTGNTIPLSQRAALQTRFPEAVIK
jgi:uncharacterized protein (TIGR02996 family)